MHVSLLMMLESSADLDSCLTAGVLDSLSRQSISIN